MFASRDSLDGEYTHLVNRGLLVSLSSIKRPELIGLAQLDRVSHYLPNNSAILSDRGFSDEDNGLTRPGRRLVVFDVFRERLEHL